MTTLVQPTSDIEETPAGLRLPWLILIVFVSSTCIMVLELVAGRIIAPYVGVSLYTWTSVIGVVLAGMSLGNYLGGGLADRWASPRLLGILVFCWAACSAVGILLIEQAGRSACRILADRGADPGPDRGPLLPAQHAPGHGLADRGQAGGARPGQHRQHRGSHLRLPARWAASSAPSPPASSSSPLSARTRSSGAWPSSCWRWRRSYCCARPRQAADAACWLLLVLRSLAGTSSPGRCAGCARVSAARGRRTTSASRCATRPATVKPVRVLILDRLVHSY